MMVPRHVAAAAPAWVVRAGGLRVVVAADSSARPRCRRRDAASPTHGSPQHHLRGRGLLSLVGIHLSKGYWRKVSRKRARDWWRRRRSAFSLICRTRSRVMPKRSPISSSVSGSVSPRPK